MAFSCPLAATPLSGLLDRNKLKKALWTLSVFNLSPPLVLSLALSPSHSLTTFSPSCSCAPKSVHTRKKETHSTSNLLLQHIRCHAHLSPALYPTLNICECSSLVVSIILSLSPCLTFSPCLPFCSFIFAGCECDFSDCPHCPFTLSVLPRITLVAMVTSLPPCWKTSLCLHKKRYLPPAELCGRTASLLSNFHML